ncbi:MAG: hypothetical protein Q4C61_17645, partial [Lachnospiraceae bacterium]|nr:hypothetical protein [Lachnospiraceae bacterium]
MGNINHEKADWQDFYTYEEYLRDKNGKNGNQDSFAYTYWETAEEFWASYNDIPVTLQERHMYSDDLCITMNNRFRELRDRQEKELQLYLLEHNGVVERWPDPCLPILWVPDEIYDRSGIGVPSSEKKIFKESGDGLVFHYFGADYQARYDGIGRSDIPVLHGIEEYDLDYKKVGSLKWGQKKEETLSTAEYESRLANLPERERYRELQDRLNSINASKNSEEIVRGGLGNRLAWLLMTIVGAACIGLLLLCMYWHLSGQDFSAVTEQMEKSAETMSRPTASLVVTAAGLLVYSVTSLGEMFLGGAGFWLVSGILLLLIIILLAIIRRRLNAKKIPIGKEVREGKQKKKGLNQEADEIKRELKKAEDALWRAEAAIKNSEGYRNAQQTKKWWHNSSVSLAREWHEAWFKCYTNRCKNPKMPSLEEK